MPRSEDSAVQSVPIPGAIVRASQRRKRKRNACAEARSTIAELRLLVEQGLEEDDADAPARQR